MAEDTAPMRVAPPISWTATLRDFLTLPKALSSQPCGLTFLLALPFAISLTFGAALGFLFEQATQPSEATDQSAEPRAGSY